MLEPVCSPRQRWRSLPSGTKRRIREALRSPQPCRPADRIINDNMHLAAYIHAYGKRGRPLLIEYGKTDCDGYSWSSYDHVPANVPALKRWHDQLHADAEGRVWWHIANRNVDHVDGSSLLRRQARTHTA